MDHPRTTHLPPIPVIDHQGEKVLYGIVFSLDPVKSFPVDLDMRVETAYPCDESRNRDLWKCAVYASGHTENAGQESQPQF